MEIILMFLSLTHSPKVHCEFICIYISVEYTTVNSSLRALVSEDIWIHSQIARSELN